MPMKKLEETKTNDAVTEINTAPEKVVHDFDSKKSTFSSKFIVVLIVVLLLGVGSGYLLANRGVSSSGVKLPTGASISKGTTEGSNDTTTFKDAVEGTLKEGGIDGEGAFHLVRPGGESQNVYLTSSIVDLSKYIDKKIKVWGQTQKAQRAGWLMDVGKVQVI
ncbi:MAG: hypothetical protein A2W22_06435 [Candidatus Levybacteria bacterium RBG_16_35_11]|nr:MAG: hypothetical protein A2W22_06435 [Candidatus Levybacteria bacterium RBG_16_35_11]